MDKYYDITQSFLKDAGFFQGFAASTIMGLAALIGANLTTQQAQQISEKFKDDKQAIVQEIKKIKQEQLTTKPTTKPTTQTTKPADQEINDETKKKWKEYFGDELETILSAAKRNGCSGECLKVLLAIRKSENGPKGTEFSVLHSKAKGTTLDTQAGWSAATIVKNFNRWKESGSKESFIEYLSKVYAPVGVKNDPKGLNKNWENNVTTWYNRF